MLSITPQGTALRAPLFTLIKHLHLTQFKILQLISSFSVSFFVSLSLSLTLKQKQLNSPCSPSWDQNSLLHCRAEFLYRHCVRISIEYLCRFLRVTEISCGAMLTSSSILFKCGQKSWHLTLILHNMFLRIPSPCLYFRRLGPAVMPQCLSKMSTCVQYDSLLVL